MRQTTIKSTIAIADAAARVWDAVVIGAGPSGAIAARELARHGVQVLLVDKATFPRSKVCGCCLNGAAIDALTKIGLGDLPIQCGGRPLRRWRWCSPAGEAICRLETGYSISREALDAALVEYALAAGAAFLDRTQAAIANHTTTHVNVHLSQFANSATVESRIVVAADGLGGQALASCPEFGVRIDPHGMHGAHAILTDDAEVVEDGTIVMACGPEGYVGLVRLEDGRLDMAAAFDQAALRAVGNPQRLARRILEAAHLPVPRSLHTSNWRGTPVLTRRRSILAANRVFLVGDAAGYTEPFTGQGLAWAMCGAIAVTPIAKQAIAEWTPQLGRQWTQTYQALIGRSQTCSRVLGWLLRSVRRVDLMIGALQHAPWLAAPVIRTLNASMAVRAIK